ncbi:hypothetical protein SAMN05444161_3918 [Rhizobiales bacterium GAS191]|nr:hypothetical protein SAMN05519103_03035 [Rhizobiales bacterium GAS113]SED75282.1 hypothetical protein SAMN05444161_3918 [Rhizobiales bacterium GAS191]
MAAANLKDRLRGGASELIDMLSDITTRPPLGEGRNASKLRRARPHIHMGVAGTHYKRVPSRIWSRTM